VPTPWLWSKVEKLDLCSLVHLYPMLFLLAMEPLHMLFKKAQEVNLLQNLSPASDAFRVSLYVDDAAVFIHPNVHDLQVSDHIL
jgi:hypothetical protein